MAKITYYLNKDDEHAREKYLKQTIQNLKACLSSEQIKKFEAETRRLKNGKK